MSTILVTGAGGYLGGHLINTLLDDRKFDGFSIRGVDNFLVAKEENYSLIKSDTIAKLVRKTRALAHARVELLKKDITRREDIKEMTEDVEIVYHLAAISGVVACSSNPARAEEINVGGTKKLLEAAMQNVEYFVFASSAAVYENSNAKLVTEATPPSPGNIYGIQKALCESMCEEYGKKGLGTVILRFANIYGKGTYVKWRSVIPTFVRCALEKKPITVHGSGKQKRNFVHIDDVVSLLKAVITPEAKGEKFNVGSFENVSIAELAQLVKRICGEGKIVHVAPRDNTPERTFDVSIEKLTKLGWKPKVTLEEGIRRTYDAALDALEHKFEESQKTI